MVGVGGSSPLGRTKSLKSFFCSEIANQFFIRKLSSELQSLLLFALFRRPNVIINSHNHFLIHFTEINLYNTTQFIVEWFQHINLLNAEKLQIDSMHKLT